MVAEMRSIELTVHNFCRKSSKACLFSHFLLDYSLMSLRAKIFYILAGFDWNFIFRTQPIPLNCIIITHEINEVNIAVWRSHDVINLLNNYIVEYSFLFPLVQKSTKKYGNYGENKVASFYGSQCTNGHKKFLMKHLSQTKSRQTATKNNSC